MLWRAKKMREIEEELARCREESSAFEDVLNALDVGIALLRGGEPWFINTVGRELLGKMHPGALPTDELEVITRGTGFILFGRKEAKKEEEPNKDVESCLEEVSSLAEEVGKLSAQAAASFGELSEVSRIINNGLEIGKEMSESSSKTEDRFKKNTEAMEELSQRSGSIIKVLTLINEISEQTNLLALNVAIEKEIGKRIQETKDQIEEVSKEANVQKERSSDVEELFHLIQYRMEVLRSRYEEVSSRLEAIFSAINDTKRLIESKLSRIDGYDHGKEE